MSNVIEVRTLNTGYPRFPTATSVDVGLVGPKVYLKGEADGYQVNIPGLFIFF